MATLETIFQNDRAKGYSVSLLGRFAFLSSLAALLFFAGCEKQEIYSIIPEIKYLSYTADTSVNASLQQKEWVYTIKFELRDGDGDVGLETPDTTTLPEYRHNLFFTQFNKKNGTFEEVPANPESPFSYTILPFEPEGNSKQQKAIVSVELSSPTYPADTIKLQFYVKDRALNSSNTVETEEIILTHLKN